MKIEYTPVRELRPHPNNARTHSKKQIRQIAKSIQQFGFCNPVLVDDAKQIIAGHGRVEAAKLLGIDAVPTVRLSHLSAADKRAYVLADNKLAEKAGWDRELLAIELQGLIELDVDIELEFAFTDPPYNVAIDGHVCGLGRIQHREFAMGCGEMSEAEFTAFLKTVFALLADNSIDGSIHQVCMDWRHIWEMLEAGRTVYSELKNLCVWNKSNAGMGSIYRSKHELVFVWKSGTAAHLNNFELGQHGRHRSNVWDYPGINTMRPGRLEELAMHPTVKPVALVADAIKDCSRRGGLVLDPFCGSGTILIAAERTGRKARALEIDPIYVDVAVRRWQACAGKSAILAGSSETFEMTADRRAKAAA